LALTRSLGWPCLLVLVLGCRPGSVSDGSSETSTSSEDGESNDETGDETGDECLEPIVHEGSLIITDESEIANYDCLVEITDNLEFEGIPMVELDGFPRLERVGGFLFIGWTDSLVAITGFPELREVGTLWIDGHSALATIDGFANLEYVVEELHLEDLPVLTSIAGLGTVTTVGSSLEIWDCDGLVDLAGLDNLAVLPGVLIGENDGLLSLAGVEQATSAGSINLLNNAALANIDALANLGTITDDVRIVGNPELASLAGLVALDEIGGDFELVDNDALIEMGEPEFPMTVGGQVHVCGNGSLTDLPSMLMATVGDVSVIHNPSLANATALEFVSALGHPNAKVAGNDDIGDYPVDPCPFVGDGVCDEPEKASGDLSETCDPQTGAGCCTIGGPTGLCLLESEGEPDCPLPSGWG
jgi:hypothetical protein